MPDETVTVLRTVDDSVYPFHELEIEVDCWIDPGQSGGRWDPSFPPHVEDYEVAKVRIIGCENVGLWHDYEQFCDHYGVDFGFDTERLMQICQEKAERKAVV